MKRISFITCIIVAAILLINCKNEGTAKYIYLNAKQLKPLGIDLSEKGLFYQNCNPKSEEDDVLAYFSFHAIDEGHYVNSSMTAGCEKDAVYMSELDSLFLGKELTNYDFYPLWAGNTKNKYNFSHRGKNIQLVPIAVCMSETKLPNRTDTLIFWFKPTESFKKALPAEINIEDYLRLPDTEE